MIEIEIKAALEGPDSPAIPGIKARLVEIGFHADGCLIETDIYFNAPDRDFRKTDEALRLRSAQNFSNDEVETFITYKGKKLDGISKTRKEYETAIADPDTMGKLMEALGYRAAHIVKKKRWYYKKGDTTVCLDEVEGLGSYIELERMVDIVDERAEVVEELVAELEALGIDKSGLTTKSYLELLNPS